MVEITNKENVIANANTSLGYGPIKYVHHVHPILFSLAQIHGHCTYLSLYTYAFSFPF
jgi:hypothetical protein